MARLSEYINAETLSELASDFAEAAGAPVRVRDADGKVLAGPAELPAGAAEATVELSREMIGTVALSVPADRPETVRLLNLMRDVLARLCGQAQQLRDRVAELETMYRLTDVFTGQTDLKQVHQLAAETMIKVTGADACSIRILDESRTELLTIAAAGLSEQYMAKGKILLTDSRIDQEVIATGQFIYIADERTDPRVLYKAEARREGIVSALCCPMSYRGQTEGIIRVYTRSPHQFDWFETSLIRGVANQAAVAIANARLHNEALAAEGLARAMRMAGEVQRRMIPTRPPSVPGLDIASVYVPHYEVGGDFYDFIELPGGNLGVAVADVVGKGVRASLLMASARAALRAHATHVYELSLVLAAVNVQMCRDVKEGDFATLFYGVVDVPNRRLTYCNAGHEPGLLLHDGQALPLDRGGGIIGLDPTMEYRHEAVRLASGDSIVLFTDGLPEAVNFNDEPFGRERIRAAALTAQQRGDSAEGLARHLLWEMRRFAGLQTRFDDLTLVAIRVQ